MSKSNLLIIDSSERNADLYYATRFIAPDPFVFIEAHGKKYILVSDLEFARAKKEFSGTAISLSQLFQKQKSHGQKIVSLAGIVAAFLKKLKIKQLSVPSDFPLAHAEQLKRAGIKLKCKKSIFFESRLLKSKKELAAIKQALCATEKAAADAISILKKSSIKKNRLYYEGELLTSESLRSAIHRSLLEQGCTGEHTIVSCGAASANPHERGSGPLKANQPIVMDIFPRSDKTLYYADFTRTVVRGKASPQLKKMYAAVLEAQKIACKIIRPGISAKKVHMAVQEKLLQHGFKTELKSGHMQGFFHSTGHGLGLEIHEPPRVGISNDILKANHVITVEPGLYYKNIGGVRLEDVILVTKKGCVNLTKFPKQLEI